jgi:hypothetical protein
MNPVLAGSIGATLGLVLAAFANLIVLPWVLRQQETRLAADWRAPVLGWGRDQLARMTKFSYRFTMPIIFGILGFVFGKKVFGV